MHDDKPQTLSGPLLTLYLNDHLTGSAAGVRLIHRIADRQSRTGSGPALAALARQIEEDQRSLRRIMRDLDVPAKPLREIMGRVGEKVGRLKLNGRLFSRSPLSDVLELEAMLLGVEGKAACWRALRELAETGSGVDTAELDRLLTRAGEQSRTLDDLRRRRSAEVFEADATEPAAERPRRVSGSRPGTAGAS
ncbi:hypothetical protein M5362_10445 [Streptomyces sp. Je 1-79]|uniref:hypothetical protein n=1 Tax=Streptomyces sp. Je 1-79 TaxID=2943847 RepID=UPI0021A3CF24|nr:hypothetical protein [Streptomyces sp. Je 1-79]MCT4353545.1 hypothetical protein [Streptomyces sp. Je 1-79]